VVTLIGHTLAALLVGWLVLVAYRWIRRQSQALAVIVAITIYVRAFLGLALFWISYLELPIAESLLGGGGFWLPVLDAIGYYQLAATAAEAGTWAQDPLGEVAAPVFVNTLAAWMRLVGISPAAAMFLNLCLYLAFVATLVRCFRPVNDWRRDLPILVAVAAYSFSPVVLVHSTQPLKEESTNILFGMGCLLSWAVVQLVRRQSSAREHGLLAAAAVALAVTFAAIAGIRWYYSLILWVVLASVLVVFAVWQRRVSIPMYAARAIPVLLLAWGGFAWGAGPYYGFIEPHLRTLGRLWNFPTAVSAMLQTSRYGFLTTAGNTNITVPLRDDPSVGRAHAESLEVNPRTVSPLPATPPRPLMAIARPRRTTALPAVAPPVSPRRGAGDPLRPSARPEELSESPAAVPVRPRQEEPLQDSATRERLMLADRGVPITVGDHLRVTAMGLAITLLPMAVVRTFVPVRMTGNEGMLLMTDLDVLVLDAGALALLVMLWRRRRLIADRVPLVLMGLLASATTAALLGYVITNFGTLSRMRPLVGIPLWILAAALARQPERAEAPIPA
jgi:hypothetical protein